MTVRALAVRALAVTAFLPRGIALALIAAIALAAGNAAQAASKKTKHGKSTHAAPRA
jgi:hypothetical protein